MGCGLQRNLRSWDRQFVGWVLVQVVRGCWATDYVRVEWLHGLRHGAGSTNHAGTGDIPAADSRAGGNRLPGPIQNGSNTLAQPRTSNESATARMVDGIYRPLMAVRLDSHCSHADRTLSRPCPAQKRKNFVSRARTTPLRSRVLPALGPKDRWAGFRPASASPSGP